MKRLTSCLPVLSVLFLLSACTTTPAPKALSAKERYAAELMAIVPPGIMFAQLAEPFAAPYATPQKQGKAHANFMRNVNLNEVDRIIREALLRHFTEAELKALAAFYSTTEGRACMAKIAPFAAEVVPACSHEATQAFRKTAADAARNLLLP
ncbi:MAG: DUF2059 domain-containing protein [bacterium]